MQLQDIPTATYSVSSAPDIITDNLTKTCLDAKTWNFAGAIIIVQQRCSGRISFMRLPVFLHFLWSHNSCAQLPSQHIVPLLIPIYSVSCTLRLSSSSLKRLGVHQETRTRTSQGDIIAAFRQFGIQRTSEVLLDIKAHKSKIVFLGDPPSLLGQSLDDEESKIMPEP